MNLTGRTRIPGPVTRGFWPGTGVMRPDFEWVRLKLATGTVTDPNSVLVSLTETDAATTVVLADLASSTNKASEGVSYRWDFSHQWDWDELIPYYMSIVTTAEPVLNTENSYVVAGFSTDASDLANHDQAFFGLHWDAGGGPDLRVGIGSNPTPADSGARTDLLHCAGSILLGPDRRFDSVHAFGVDASYEWDFTKHVTSATTVGDAEAVFNPFVALGRSNDTPDSQSTIGFRAYMMIGPRQATWFPG